MRTHHVFRPWHNNQDLVLKKTGRDFMLLCDSLPQLEASKPGWVFSVAASQSSSPPISALHGKDCAELQSMSSE